MKKGISLVALVITIIVLIILTGAVILSFQDGGIIDRADQAVKDSNDAVLEEKITMMNLEYTQKLKKKFTPETRETLKAIVKQSGIDLDKLLVYYDTVGEGQHVFYKIDKVTKSEVEWFLNNEVVIGEENKKIYFLFGDVNLDGEIDNVDEDIVTKAAMGNDTTELPLDEYDYYMLIGDIDASGNIDMTDSYVVNRIMTYDIYNELFNIESFNISNKEEQIKTYFGIE